jgi:hypothetical protein
MPENETLETPPADYYFDSKKGQALAGNLLDLRLGAEVVSNQGL